MPRVFAERVHGIVKKYLPMKLKIVFILLLSLSTYSCSDSSNKLSTLGSNATILAFGDSLTYGTGAKAGEDYPSILASLSNLSVINAGIPGEISSKGLQRLPDLLKQHNPDLLILIHGGNDILKKLPRLEQKNNLLMMIELATEQNIEVLLLGVPEPGIFLKSAAIYEEIVNETGVASEFSILPDILGDTSLKSDVAHPNAKGYREMAKSIFEYLEDNSAIEN